MCIKSHKRATYIYIENIISDNLAHNIITNLKPTVIFHRKYTVLNKQIMVP